MTIDVNQLMTEIKNTATGIIGSDVSVLAGFSRRQLEGIATQTELVVRGISSGEITPATQDFFLNQIIKLVKNFVESLAGLIMTTIQRVLNAIVNLIWRVISRATGINLGIYNPS